MIGTPPRNIWSQPWTSTKFPKRRRTICLLSWSVRRKILSRSDSADSDQPVRHDQFIATSRAASYNRAAQPFSLRSRRQRKAWGVSPGNESKKNIPSPRGGRQRKRYGSGCVFHGIADPKGTTLPPAFGG